MEENEFKPDPKDVVIRRLQSVIWMMSGMHCSDGNKEDPHCIYCGTEFPCHTVRLARRSATAWSGLEE